ncbi:IQ domain-containing protein K isoform X6 [Cavia porcellus]|uniref:IQ domain-containing protein K isoform X6 n=1 Tax=Cavia porcellus TaxID=10141 RepID=UPI002FE14294
MNAVSSVTKSMAATPQLSSRAPQREDCTGSADSVTTPNSVPTVSPVSPEPVSPGQVAEPPGKNLWEQICEEYEAELPSFPEGYIIKHENPVIVSLLEELISHDFNTEQYFPASQFITASNIPCPQNKSETVDPKTCSPREYLETFIFPVLLPGMASLLHQAKQEKCFEPKSKEDKGAVHGILLHPMCRGMAKVPPTTTNPTLPPTDRRGSSDYHTVLLERLPAQTPGGEPQPSSLSPSCQLSCQRCDKQESQSHQPLPII